VVNILGLYQSAIANYRVTLGLEDTNIGAELKAPAPPEALPVPRKVD
jgi:hypothetical protein